jgi:hypothetical protein
VLALAFEQRKPVLRRMLKGGDGVFRRFRQRNPGLDTEEIVRPEYRD